MSQVKRLNAHVCDQRVVADVVQNDFDLATFPTGTPLLYKSR